jgi:hypothetical protein
MWLLFILFLILGLAVFWPVTGQGRIVLLVIFVVLMLFWLLTGLGAFSVGGLGSWGR